MASIDISATMDAIAEALIPIWQRAYAWPTDSVSPPCFLIGYPEGTINLDFTFADGSDEAIFPLYYVAGQVSLRNTRDEISNIISGARAVKSAIDGDLGGAVNSANVGDCEITEITIGGVAYAAAKFNIQIIS